MLFVGTAVIFFAVVNAVKLVPYFFLGQFDSTNLATSVVLFPVALIADAGRHPFGKGHQSRRFLRHHLHLYGTDRDQVGL